MIHHTDEFAPTYDIYIMIVLYRRLCLSVLSTVLQYEYDDASGRTVRTVLPAVLLLWFVLVCLQYAHIQYIHDIHIYIIWINCVQLTTPSSSPSASPKTSAPSPSCKSMACPTPRRCFAASLAVVAEALVTVLL